MKTNSKHFVKKHFVQVLRQSFLPALLLTAFQLINLCGFGQTGNDFKADAVVISSAPGITTGMELLSQQIGAPCNFGCATGDFEYDDFSVDFGYTKRYACGNGPNNNPMFPNQHNFPCMRTTNKMNDKYWWWVDHAAALSSQTTNCSYPSTIPCQVLLNSPEMATVD